MGDSKEEFERIRMALESADDSLAAALDARLDAVLELKDLKSRAPDAYFSAPRDHEVIARVLERVQKFPRDAVSAVMTEVLSACNQLVRPVRVAFAGLEGGFGHLAARRHFGSSADLSETGEASDVLADVQRGRAAFGVLPFETSNDGAVTDTLNLLARSDLKISAEVAVRRSFHLLSRSGERGEVKKIYGTASAIAACEEHLGQRFAEAVVIEKRSALIASQHAADESDAAALANDLVAELSGLTVVDRCLEDVADLETRYAIVGNDFPPRTGKDRTAVAVALHDAPGVLIDCLRPFSDREINLYRLETRPARGWEFRYLILFEVDGHITDRPILAAIEELRTSSRYVKVLGSYPRVGDE